MKMNRYNHIITDTRSPKPNEFILQRLSNLTGDSDDVREMISYIEELGNIRIIRIPDHELPDDHRGEKLIGFRIEKIKDE
jgi:hypothetical protein|tara:strand:- start:195 stop:434 length:240 start_codon:yes stop_codon:yes gene_type:complete